MSENTTAPRGLIGAVTLISAATLAVQVLQTRLFSVMLWHHLTYMVVTITLLGFAAGGSLLAAFPRIGRAQGDPRLPISCCCSLFAITMVAAFSILAHSNLDTLDIEKDRSKYFFLFLNYAYLIVPFLFSGMAVAIALQQYPAKIHRTYFWNLLGSGAGAFLFVLLVRPLTGPGALFLFASLGGVAGLCALCGARAFWPARILAILALAIWPLSLALPSAAHELVPVEPARSKAQNLFGKFFTAVADHMHSEDPDYPLPDESLRTTQWTPLCRLDTLPVPKPARQAELDRSDPKQSPRAQVHVFQDGDAPTVIWSKTLAAEHPYDRHFYGLGYRLVDRPRVLIIGPGGGNDVETALHYQAASVTAVDINGDTLALVQGRFKDFTGDIYGRPGVRAVHSEGRSFLRREGGEYDLLQMSGTDTYAALSSGSYIFSESYLYTVEAFTDFFEHMADDGVISVIRFRFDPPRETLKLVATAATALKLRGIEDPSRHFIVVNQTDAQAQELAKALLASSEDPRVKGLVEDFAQYAKEPMRYSVTLMRKQPFTADDVTRIEQALGPMNPGPAGEVGIVHHELYYAAGAREETPTNEYTRLLSAMASGDASTATFHEDYEYDTKPATDDRPFFFNFHSWNDVKLFGSSSDAGYEALTGSEPIGLYILAALILQTAIATLLLVILPLFRLGFSASAGNFSRLRVFTYFLALGLAYLLVEITTIQRFVLYLGHPTYSLTVGLASFLIFSGLGSAWAGSRGAGRRTATIAALVVVVLLLAHAMLLPTLLVATLDLGEGLRIGLTMLTIAPVAFAMGIPFPTGLRALEGEAASLVPWAFGVNGAASVLASILSIVIGMEAGFTTVFMVAAALYLVAATMVPITAPARSASTETAKTG